MCIPAGPGVTKSYYFNNIQWTSNCAFEFFKVRFNLVRCRPFTSICPFVQRLPSTLNDEFIRKMCESDVNGDAE